MSRSTVLGTLEYATETAWCEASSTFGARLAVLGELNFDGLSQTKAPAERTVQYLGDGSMPIRGVKEGELTTDIWLAGHGSTTATTVTLEEHEDILGYVLGNAASCGTGTTASGGTAAVPTTAAASGLSAGGIVFCGAKGDGGGDGQAAAVTSHTGSSLTLLTALPAGMTNGQVIYSSALLYPWEAAGSAAIQSMRFRGLTANQHYAMRGCWPKAITLDGLGNGAKPRASITWGVSDWDPVSATFPSATAIDAFNPAPCAGGSLFVANRGTSTRTTYAVRDFTITHNLNTIPVYGPGGNSALQTVVGAVRGPATTTVSFVVDCGNASATPTWPGLWDSDSQFYHLLYTANGAATGQRVAVYCPNTCIADRKPVQTSVDGIARERITMTCYTGATTTTALTLSSFRLALG